MKSLASLSVRSSIPSGWRIKPLRFEVVSCTTSVSSLSQVGGGFLSYEMSHAHVCAALGRFYRLEFYPTLAILKYIVHVDFSGMIDGYSIGFAESLLVFFLFQFAIFDLLMHIARSFLLFYSFFLSYYSDSCLSSRLVSHLFSVETH